MFPTEIFMKTTRTNFFATLAVAFILSACGGGGGGSTAAPTATTTTLTPTVNPTVPGQATVLRAVVAGTNPTGTVTFFDNPSVTPVTLGTGTVTAGVATLTVTLPTSPLVPRDQHYLTAVYGGDANNATSTSAMVIAYINADLAFSPVVASVPAPTYAAGSQPLAAFNLLNAERSRCGFGMVAQNTMLDQAANAHAAWVVNNNITTHAETPGTPGFTGADVIARGQAAGYSYFQNLPNGTEVMATTAGVALDSVVALRGLLSAPYHAVAAMSPNLDVGIGMFQSASAPSGALTDAFAINFGTSAASAGPQEIQGGAVLTYPCQGSTGVDYALYSESPNPVAPRNLLTSPIGTPIVLRTNAANVLMVSAASMAVAATGAPVALLPVRGMGSFAVADTTGVLPPNNAFLMPDQPLQPNTSYTVSVQGVVYVDVFPSPSFSVAGTSCSGGNVNGSGVGLAADWTGLTCTNGLWAKMAGVPFSTSGPLTFTFTTGAAAAR